MYRRIGLAACAVLLGTVLTTLAVSIGSDTSAPGAGTPYASALSSAGIPSALARENACSHTNCVVPPQPNPPFCRSTPRLNLDCVIDPSGLDCDSTPCP